VTRVRILHTSDWHLGRSFGTVSLHDHQQAFTDWLIGLAVDEHVDLVVVAGDVYDRAVPPVHAIELFDATLGALRDHAVQVVVIAGNHDSAERITVYDHLVAGSGIHIRGGYRSPGEVLTLTFPDGPLDVVALPYLDPALASSDLVATLMGADASAGRVRRPTHEQVLAHCIAETAAHRHSTRSLAVAHAFVVGGDLSVETSESERTLSIGGSAAVSVDTFDGFSYTALGHLHTPQVVGGRPTVRYSGTPLAYSFSETAPKSVVLVDLSPTGDADITTVDVPLGIGRRVTTVTGTIDALLTEPPADAVDCFVRAHITDAAPVVDAKVRLQLVYPHVVEVELRPAVTGVGTGDLITSSSRRSLDPLEVATGYWHDLYGTEPSEAEAHLIAETLLAQTR
jgi:exonuclease SbcD